MQWELIVALVIAIPVILFPAAYVWYVNVGGIMAAVRGTREKRAVPENKVQLKQAVPQDNEYQEALIDALKRYPWK